MSIRTKLILAVGIPVLLVYSAILAIGYIAQRRTEFHQMEQAYTQLVEHYAAQFNGRFSTMAAVARTNAGFLETCPQLDEQGLYSLLTKTVTMNPNIYGACVAFSPDASPVDRKLFAPYAFRANKTHRTMDIGTEGYDYRKKDWYLIPFLLKKPVWSDPYYDEGGGDA